MKIGIHNRNSERWKNITNILYYYKNVLIYAMGGEIRDAANGMTTKHEKKWIIVNVLLQLRMT